ncbi:MAG: intermembrane transport protein PqiB [Oceanococcus sp.]
MTDQLQRAVREPSQRISPIWLVPIVAALIGTWMLWHNYNTRGTLISIRMDTAEGIEPGKTFVKAREVSVGKVVDVQLADNFDYTVVTVRINSSAQRMLRADTRFWVVRPRVGREGISGLSTVLSGSYIRLQPGTSEQESDEFVALETPPSAPPGAEGLRLTIVGARATAASAGDPVEFQGFNVGQVESAEFDVESRQLICRLFIRAPFDRLVTTTTRFWSGSGLQIRLDAGGFAVDMSSLESLLGGGISFGVPEGLGQGGPVDPDMQFTLYADADAARQGTFNRVLKYVLLIDDTVRGLSKGAPVEYRGVRVGTVVEVPYSLNRDAAVSMAAGAIPVLIHIEPQRLDRRASKVDDEAWGARFGLLFEFGLRASLSSGNLLTGSLLVDLDFYPEAPSVAAEEYEGITVFPTTSGGFAQLEQKLSSLLDKLNQMQVEPVLARLDSGLASAQGAMVELKKVAANLNQMLADPATQAVPAELRNSLQGLGPQSAMYQDLGQTLRQLNLLMRDLQPLIKTLDEKPNALIFDRPENADPMPRAADNAP